MNHFYITWKWGRFSPDSVLKSDQHAPHEVFWSKCHVRMQQRNCVTIELNELYKKIFLNTMYSFPIFYFFSNLSVEHHSNTLWNIVEHIKYCWDTLVWVAEHVCGSLYTNTPTKSINVWYCWHKLSFSHY